MRSELTMRPRLGPVWLAVVALTALAAPARAQIDTSKPIPIKTLKPRLVKFRGEVMNATAAAITVRSLENEAVIRTFSYSPKVGERMQAIIDHGGYQYGDRVEIQYEAGSNVARRIKGKPSQPL